MTFHVEHAYSPEECEEKLVELNLQLRAEIVQINAEREKQERARVRNFRTRALLE